MQAVHGALQGIAVGAVAFRAGAGNQFDAAGGDVDHPHGVAFGVGEPDVAGGVEGDAFRVAQLRFLRRAAVAGVTFLAGAGDGAHRAIGSDAADAMARMFAKLNRPIRSAHDAVGIVDLGGEGGAAVTGGTWNASAGERFDGPFSGECFRHGEDEKESVSKNDAVQSPESRVESRELRARSSELVCVRL